MFAFRVVNHDGAALDPELVSRGYERRTTAPEPRLSEIVEEYRRLGFEVSVVEHRVAAGACGDCFEPGARGSGGCGEFYGDVYVRRGPLRADAAARPSPPTGGSGGG